MPPDELAAGPDACAGPFDADPLGWAPDDDGAEVVVTPAEPVDDGPDAGGALPDPLDADAGWVLV